MKVKDLYPGMLLSPAEDGVFISMFSDKLIGVIDKKAFARQQVWGGANTFDRLRGKFAIYLGQRKDLKLDKQEVSDWSNRYVLIDGKIMPVDSAIWRQIEPVTNTYS